MPKSLDPRTEKASLNHGSENRLVIPPLHADFRLRFFFDRSDCVYRSIPEIGVSRPNAQ